MRLTQVTTECYKATVVTILNGVLGNSSSSEFLPRLGNWKACRYFQQHGGSVSLVSNQRAPLVLQRVQHIQFEKPCSNLWGQNR